MSKIGKNIVYISEFLILMVTEKYIISFISINLKFGLLFIHIIIHINLKNDY